MDMVEKVARAICEAEGFDPDHDGNGDRDGTWQQWMNYTTMARAAIEAMKPLPPELFVHSVNSYADERGNDYEDHAEWWADVIDAAITSPPQSVADTPHT